MSVDQGGPRGGLLRHPDFLKLWSGQTVSTLGDQFSFLAFPTVAIVALGASPAQVGLLVAIGFLAFPVLGLFVGVFVDRHHRRPIMIVCDIVRALTLASIPLAFSLGMLTLAQLYLVALITGVCAVFFDVSYQSYLPVLVPRADLVEGNSKLEVTNSLAQVGGPALAGFAIQVLGAARAVSLDALSFVASVASLSLIHAPEPPVATAAAPGIRGFLVDLREGLAYVLGHRVLRRVAACTATWNLGSNAVFALQLIYAYRVLHFSPGLVGVLFALGSVGTLAGAVLAARWTRVLGVGPTLVIAPLVGAAALFVIPLAPAAVAAPLWAASFAVGGAVGVIYNITQVSLRQAVTPDRVQGRMQATMRTIVWGTIPVGAMAGGLLAGVLGLLPTMVLGAAVASLAFLWPLTPGILGIRDQPEPVGADS